MSEYCATEIIADTRHGRPLSEEAIRWWIRAYLEGEVTDYQMSAWLMAAAIRGLSCLETLWLTQAMTCSGVELDWSHLPGPAVDKHSTGGVGDKITLIAVPAAAAAGLFVPKLSGRGLGFTGGTLDKLEAIPGFQTALSVEEFRAQVARTGCVISAASAELAPGDRRLYALRDATATVESISLAASSIMSKKLAGGAPSIVLDVKTGRGAIMPEEADARELARLMVEIGKGAGRRIVAVLSSMRQPLGSAIGNALELKEAISVLAGSGPADVRELAVRLAGWMLALGGLAGSAESGAERAAACLSGGQALRKLREMVAAQGGDTGCIDSPDLLPRAPEIRPVCSETEGFVTGIDARRLGLLSMGLGAGRERKADDVDPAVGILLRRKVGDPVARGEALAEVHARSAADANRATHWVRSAYQLGSERVEPPPLILDVIE